MHMRHYNINQMQFAIVQHENKYGVDMVYFSIIYWFNAYHICTIKHALFPGLYQVSPEPRRHAIIT